MYILPLYFESPVINPHLLPNALAAERASDDLKQSRHDFIRCSEDMAVVFSVYELMVRRTVLVILVCSILGRLSFPAGLSNCEETSN